MRFSSPMPENSSMRDFMRSPAAALIWQIWARNRALTYVVIGMALFGCLFNLALPLSLRAAPTNRFGFGAREALQMMNTLLPSIGYLFLLAIFNGTEYNASKSSAGFPHRLFTLPITSFRLVAIPMVLGALTVELLYWLWIKVVVLNPDELAVWFAIILPTYMVLCQTISWTFDSVGALRLLV